jgi:ADP-ribose pyrophosphatase YjhB (NUDIX family)
MDHGETQSSPIDRDPVNTVIYDQIAEYRAKGEYRPGQAVVVYSKVHDQDGGEHAKYLLTRTTPRGGLPDTAGMWALHQGGIEDGQTLEDNLKTELKDELQVTEYDLNLKNTTYAVVPFTEIPYDKPRVNKRGGDEKGKVQLTSAVEFTGTLNHLQNPSSEVAEAGWYGLDTALKLIDNAPNTSEQKKAFMKESLIATSKRITKSQ